MTITRPFSVPTHLSNQMKMLPKVIVRFLVKVLRLTPPASIGEQLGDIYSTCDAFVVAAGRFSPTELGFTKDRTVTTKSGV